jgi:hypothetical protein
MQNYKKINMKYKALRMSALALATASLIGLCWWDNSRHKIPSSLETAAEIKAEGQGMESRIDSLIKEMDEASSNQPNYTNTNQYNSIEDTNTDYIGSAEQG